MLRRVPFDFLAFLAILTFPIAPAIAQTTAASSPAQAASLLNGKWQYSIDGGATFSDTLGEPPANTAIVAKCEFTADDPGRYTAMELAHNLDTTRDYSFALNKAELRRPAELEGLALRTIPLIDTTMLVRGPNVLTATGYLTRLAKVSAARSLDITLVGLESKDLKVVVGPILGARGDDYLTLACRTNVPCRVTVKIDGSFPPAGGDTTQPSTPKTTWREISQTSQPGLFHRFRMEGVGGMQIGTYRLAARTDDGAGVVELGPFTLSSPAKAGGTVRFVVVGDSRTNPADWGLVAAAIPRTRPQFLVHTGDLVEKGKQEWRWRQELFEPASFLFDSTPTFIAPGNHDEASPLTALMFIPPAGFEDWNRWEQVVGPVHMIGVDGRGDWSPQSENARWLEQVLARSRSEYIFLFNHYPPYGSGPHEQLDQAGRPKEESTRQARDVILPLLAKYQATAMICGHDHLYERSEPPEGVTIVIAGGGGAPLKGPTSQAAVQNPYSKALASKLHYCLFTIDGRNCTMKVFTPSDAKNPLDTRTWPARVVVPAPPPATEPAPVGSP